MSKNPEFWWIYTEARETWAGLRLATFPESFGEQIVLIHNEPPHRQGPRIWSHVQDAEGWFKVAQVPIPNMDMIAAALVREVGGAVH